VVVDRVNNFIHDGCIQEYGDESEGNGVEECDGHDVDCRIDRP
tara:strand:- start:575 stop:703 length:129 start_codon:yes stop_codon:yes gene_type:complete